MKNLLATAFLKGATRAPRTYFAPLVGAIKAVRAELTTSVSVQGVQPSGGDFAVKVSRQKKR